MQEEGKIDNEVKGIIQAIAKEIKEYKNEHGADYSIGFMINGIWYNIKSDNKDVLNNLLENVIVKGNDIKFKNTPDGAKDLNIIAFKQKSKKTFENKEYNDKIVNIKGKNHITYQGLLELAHKDDNLVNFEILEQYISDDMKKAWVKVRAHIKGGRYFDGIGSSTPENTSKMTESHPIEMAHTRAKGRALRDFLNIGKAMMEELKGD